MHSHKRQHALLQVRPIASAAGACTRAACHQLIKSSMPRSKIPLSQRHCNISSCELHFQQSVNVPSQLQSYAAQPCFSSDERQPQLCNVHVAFDMNWYADAHSEREGNFVVLLWLASSPVSKASAGTADGLYYACVT